MKKIINHYQDLIIIDLVQFTARMHGQFGIRYVENTSGQIICFSLSK